MEIRQVYEEIEKQCKKSFIAGYDMYHTIALVYIWTKEDFFTGDLIIFVESYLKLINIGDNKINLIFYKDIISIRWGIKNGNKQIWIKI